MRFSLILLLSCIASIPMQSATGDSSELLKLKEWMTGSFHNGHQAANDTNYYHINLEMVPIWTDSQEGHWMYVEQALYTMKDKPYRQRVYELFTGDDGVLNSKVYSLPEKDLYVNQGSTPSFFERISPGDLLDREGCTVFMESMGDYFMGSTNEKDCKSDFRGASYATAKVRVFEERLISWDQGFNESEEQVWGATKGGYIFDKVKRMKYPETKQIEQVDNYFGTEVADPYRWLEDPDDPQTDKWIDAQNATTNEYLSQIPFRQSINERLASLVNYAKYEAAKQQGEYIYYEANEGSLNQPIIYRQKGMDAKPEIILDPNKLSTDGTTSVTFWNFSHDGKYMAYGLAEGGSDWTEIHVLDLEAMQPTGDVIKNVKFSSANWHGDGFYYSAFEVPDGNLYAAENSQQKSFYHELGRPQSEDAVIFFDKERPKDNPAVYATEDNSIVILSRWKGTSNNSLAFSFADDLDRGFTDLVSDFENNYGVVGNTGKHLLVLTDQGAPNSRLVSINLKKPKEKHWRDIIPESELPFKWVVMAGGKLLAWYLEDVQTKVKVFDLEGNFLHDMELPGTGTISKIIGKASDRYAYFDFTSFLSPKALYRYDTEENKVELFKEAEYDFPAEDYETKQVFYESKDGTEIPMFITAKKDIELNGQNPTLLYGYGGFNVTIEPEFNPLRMVFLENGGIFAVANLRGGGEYGEAWHKAGMLEKKQNVFDDFISAADFLCNESYTNKNKLAIEGRSNGGLLVGAVMCQRPDLCSVALPTVGVMDMLRYHKFTIGWAWAVEFGSAENEEHFDYLHKYSPLHNLKPANYPATLVLTADRDDRVVPAHSFKFTSALQAANTGNQPTIIRIDRKAGHGSGKALSQKLDEWSDIWAFVFKHLGMTFKTDS